MIEITIDFVTEDQKDGVQLTPDLYFYQGSGKDVTGDEQMRLNTIGICIVEKGKYSIHLNGSDYRLRRGDVLICSTNDLYNNVKFSEDFYGTIIFSAVGLVSEIIGSDSLQDILSLLYETPVFRLDATSKKLIFKFTSYINQRNILLTGHNSNPGYILLVKALLYDLFSAVFGITKKKKAVSKYFPKPELIFRNFMNILISLPSKPHEIEFYSSELKISPKYLSNVCAKISGKTARRWIDDYIMQDACRYLNNSNLSIKEISEKLLFTNFSFFCKAFKSYSGTTPGNYRKKSK